MLMREPPRIPPILYGATILADQYCLLKCRKLADCPWSPIITPRACARGKVIGRVVVVVSRKIAISRDLGT